MARRRGNQQAMVEMRRLRVASLLLRKLTQREIVEVLPRYQIVNPETGKPYSLGTVNSDIQHLKGQWREQAGAYVEEHRSRLLAELQEIKREAWAQKNGRLLLEAVGKEMALLRLHVTPLPQPEREPGNGVDLSGLDEAALDQVIANLRAVMGEHEGHDTPPGQSQRPPMGRGPKGGTR